MGEVEPRLWVVAGHVIEDQATFGVEFQHSSECWEKQSCRALAVSLPKATLGDGERLREAVGQDRVEPTRAIVGIAG